MADPLTITASALSIISTAIQSTKSLYDAVPSYGSRDKPLGRLQDELQDLAETLDALKQVLDADSSMLELLRGSIDRCSRACLDFEQSMEILDPSASRNIEDYPGADSLATSTAMTAERAYYHCALRFIRRSSNIPVPTLYGAFEVDDSFILIIEHVDGVSMSDLSEDQKSVVRTEVEQHLATLRGIKSNTIGGPSGIVLPPYRVMRLSDKNEWPQKVTKDDKFVFCHNDLSQHNIIVDPRTMKIKAIIDWEYAGYFPGHFEWPFYERRGPSIALDGEHDHSAELLQFMEAS
ncbi:hypothetical protein N7486_010382 [Penicillium sp. IBT 16267x]|nr:hypothetical protein N7486_010382 [Penicillium sp. IBT 16267x]